MDICVHLHGPNDRIYGAEMTEAEYSKLAQVGIVPSVGDMIFFAEEDVDSYDYDEFRDKHGFYMEDGFKVTDVSYGPAGDGIMIITLFS